MRSSSHVVNSVFELRVRFDNLSLPAIHVIFLYNYISIYVYVHIYLYYVYIFVHVICIAPHSAQNIAVSVYDLALCKSSCKQILYVTARAAALSPTPPLFDNRHWDVDVWLQLPNKHTNYTANTASTFRGRGGRQARELSLKTSTLWQSSVTKNP